MATEIVQAGCDLTCGCRWRDPGTGDHTYNNQSSNRSGTLRAVRMRPQRSYKRKRVTRSFGGDPAASDCRKRARITASMRARAKRKPADSPQFDFLFGPEKSSTQPFHTLVGSSSIHSHVHQNDSTSERHNTVHLEGEDCKP